jgi:hypothetical protein
MVIIIAPGFDGSAGLGEAQKDMLVKTLVAQTAVERFNECILDWFARRDVVSVEPSDRPAQHRHTDQLVAAIADDHFWAPTFHHQTLQFAHHAHATDRGIDHRGQAFAAKVVHYAQDAEAATLLSASDTKSSDQRRLIVSGNASGVRVPIARLRRPRRRTISLSSR